MGVCRRTAVPDCRLLGAQDYRSTSRFQRLVHSSRFTLIASQSGAMINFARSPTGAIFNSAMLTSTILLTGPFPISLARTVCTLLEMMVLMNSCANGLMLAFATGQADASKIGAPSLG